MTPDDMRRVSASDPNTPPDLEGAVHARGGRRFARDAAVSLCAGGAGAAATAAVIVSVVMWSMQSSNDHLSSSPAGLGGVAIAIGVCVMTLLARGRARGRVLRRLGLLAALVAIGLALWSARELHDVYTLRHALRFVDSTGATVLAAAATIAAIAAVVLSLIAARYARSISRLTAVGAFLVVALVLSLLTHQSVSDYRADVWRPDRTAAATAPAPLPDSIGPVRYQRPVNNGNGRRATVYAVGDGFVIDTRFEVTAYDGMTGQTRWRADDYGTSGRVLVVHRDSNDTSGIVVVFLYYGLVAFDGSSGEVLWRRQYNDGGEITAATGSVDALGMAVFYSDSPGEGPDRLRTRLYSLDPATGDERWSRPISCSSPTLSRGADGQFAYDCGKPSIIDAHDGKTTDVPGDYNPDAGPNAYVASTPWPHGDPTTVEDVTRVFDTAGQVIDEIPNSYPVSRPHNGLILLYGGRGSWLLRDYRNHRSTPIPLQAQVRVGSDLEDVDTIWLNKHLLVSTPYEREHFLQLVDLAHPTDAPTVAASPCTPDQYPTDVDAVAGALLVNCDGIDLLGLVPGKQ